MKNTIKFTIISIVLTQIILSGCSKDSNGLYINIEKRDKVSFLDLFSNIEIIPLETNEKSLIKEITKLSVADSCFFLLDYGKSEILKFNKDGSFNSKISNRGNGPNEYINISDFNFNQRKIELLSPVNRSIYEFDLNCNFIKKNKLPDIEGAYISFTLLNADTMAFWTFDYKNRLKFYSIKRNKIFYETFPEKDNIFNKFMQLAFPYQNFLCRSSENTVYKITENCKIEKAFNWDFGSLNNDEKKLEEEQRLVDKEEIQDFIKKVLSSENSNYVFHLFGGNSNYLFTQILRKNKQINILYNRKTTQSYVFERSSEGASFYPVYWCDEYIIGIQPEVAKSIEETLPDKILDENSRAIKMKISEFDNPILIKYHFKK